MSLAPSEGFKEFNFLNLAHITTNFERVVIMQEGFKINVIEDVTRLGAITF